MAASLRPGDEAPNVALADGAGDRVELAELWEERPLLLAFLRHYG